MDARVDLDSEPGDYPQQKCAKDGGKLSGSEGMPGAGLTEPPFRKALSDMLALKPYRGKPAVRNFRGGNGDVGIIRSPVRAIALLDRSLVVDPGFRGAAADGAKLT
jgi:hypothetical protein